jgi:hypothetical protein
LLQPLHKQRLLVFCSELMWSHLLQAFHKLESIRIQNQIYKLSQLFTCPLDIYLQWFEPWALSKHSSIQHM